MKTRKISSIARACYLDELVVDFGMFDFECAVVMGPRTYLALYLSNNFDRSVSDMQEIVDEHITSKATVFKFVAGGHAPVVWLPGHPKTPGEIAALAHEAFHVVCHMLQHFDTELAAASEETYAHAISHMVDEVLTRLKIPRKVTRRAA